MNNIEFDFQKAIKQAEQLEDISSELKKLSNNKFENTLSRLSSNWKGDSANAYLKKGKKLQTNIGNTAKDLNTVANNIRNIAKTIYNAEMAAKRVAEERAGR